MLHPANSHCCSTEREKKTGDTLMLASLRVETYLRIPKNGGKALYWFQPL